LSADPDSRIAVTRPAGSAARTEAEKVQSLWRQLKIRHRQYMRACRMYNMFLARGGRRPDRRIQLGRRERQAAAAYGSVLRAWIDFAQAARWRM
jgi:hypothetical protein